MMKKKTKKMKWIKMIKCKKAVKKVKQIQKQQIRPFPQNNRKKNKVKATKPRTLNKKMLRTMMNTTIHKAKPFPKKTLPNLNKFPNNHSKQWSKKHQSSTTLKITPSKVNFTIKQQMFQSHLLKIR